ncbi:MAG: hypothetical protein AB7R89_16070 [Dehalococcoidia bacterium]
MATITVETTVEHLGDVATRADLERYLDGLDDALTAAYPAAVITVREGTHAVRVTGDLDAEDVQATVDAHFAAGGWA